MKPDWAGQTGGLAHLSPSSAFGLAVAPFAADVLLAALLVDAVGLLDPPPAALDELPLAPAPPLVLDSSSAARCKRAWSAVTVARATRASILTGVQLYG